SRRRHTRLQGDWSSDVCSSDLLGGLAHEAIRPTDVLRRPDDLKQHLDSKQFKLYQLIWRRFVASQMTPAVFETTKVDFDLGRFEIGRASCRERVGKWVVARSTK